MGSGCFQPARFATARIVSSASREKSRSLGVCGLVRKRDPGPNVCWPLFFRQLDQSSFYAVRCGSYAREFPILRYTRSARSRLRRAVLRDVHRSEVGANARCFSLDMSENSFRYLPFVRAEDRKVQQRRCGASVRARARARVDSLRLNSNPNPVPRNSPVKFTSGMRTK